MGDRKGLRSRLKLNKLLGGTKMPVVGDPLKTKLPKRVRLNLFVTRVKLRLKGVKTPSTSGVTKGEVPATGVPMAVPPSPRL